MIEDCWNLDHTFADFILPRLLYFRNWVCRMGVPMDFINDEEAWEEVLDEMVWAFTYVHQDKPSVAERYIDDAVFEEGDISLTFSDFDAYQKGRIQDEINLARCQNGLNLFAKYYLDLWD